MHEHFDGTKRLSISSKNQVKQCYIYTSIKKHVTSRGLDVSPPYFAPNSPPGLAAPPKIEVAPGAVVPPKPRPVEAVAAGVVVPKPNPLGLVVAGAAAAPKPKPPPSEVAAGAAAAGCVPRPNPKGFGAAAVEAGAAKPKPALVEATGAPREKPVPAVVAAVAGFSALNENPVLTMGVAAFKRRKKTL